ncbi:hypothetical protein CAEBREN_07158 [Caenorhabditis brenneri]|uniref:Uncharacterized protein n=1 Tax=Caenorhabditis brenneri TaxID=135651 RepID=G0N135_CAEBE|nr:hypothetical protein CAEBREN_07158 [Caenorhabditis brenneri]
MAGIVRKLFKSGSGNSSKKATAKKQQNHSDYEVEEEDEDDYAELHFTPTTSKAACTPPRFSTSITPPPIPFQFTQSGLPLCIHQTPKLHHDETLDSDLSFEQPSQKRRKSARILDISNSGEDQIYEHTQYQLMKWERQETRHQERRKRKRAARHVEQENYVNEAFGQAVQLNEEHDEELVIKLRKERDEYKREAQKYKTKFEELEKRYKQLERRQQQMVQQQQQQNFGFQPFNGFNVFNAAPPFPLFQPPSQQQAPPTFLLQPTPSLIQQQPQQPIPFMAPRPSTSSAPFPSLGPSGPMAPRYPDPYSFEEQDDDDTSLSDLSNSSKSDTSLDGTK